MSSCRDPGANEQHVVKRLTPHLGRFDENFQIGARRRLADEIIERLRAQRIVFICAAVGIDERVAVAHAFLLA